MDNEKNYQALGLISQKSKLETEDINALLKLSQSDDSEIRSYVAQLLVMSYGKDTEKALINMCGDADEIVRTNACDSLSAFATGDVYNKLTDCVLNDKSNLVKTYALLSLADIAGQAKCDTEELKQLFIRFSSDKNVSVSAACFRGMYILGNKDCLKNLLNLILSENYQDRCMVVNMLGDILNNENQSQIISELKRIRQTESSKAVVSTIDSIIYG